MSPEILRPALSGEKPVIANLIQLYLHDMTEFMPFPVGLDGRFQYDFLDRFWRYPYLIMEDGEIAGFVLVIDECPLTGRTPCWFIAEFFVLKADRGRGLGRSAAREAFGKHKGQWHLASPHANTAAQAFWATVMADRAHVSHNLRFEGDDWRLYDFST
jgi:predicted acetyltransferase